jgi:hypothetical protein
MVLEACMKGPRPIELVHHQRDARATRVELLGNRVSVLSEEIEDVRTAKTKVSPWCPEMGYLASLRPIVDRLQVDLTESGNL